MYTHTTLNREMAKREMRCRAPPYAKVFSMHIQWSFIRQAHPTMPYVHSIQFVAKLAFITCMYVCMHVHVLPETVEPFSVGKEVYFS